MDELKSFVDSGTTEITLLISVFALRMSLLSMLFLTKSFNCGSSSFNAGFKFCGGMLIVQDLALARWIVELFFP